MITATLTLTRPLDDGACARRKYFLIADYAAAGARGCASIVPMSAGAPMPDADQLTVRGGENEAILAAVDAVCCLVGNAEFAAEINLEPT